MAKALSRGWFEEYKCGCVSEIVRTKKELLGYCKSHGDDRRHAHHVHPNLAAFDQRGPDARRHPEPEDER